MHSSNIAKRPHEAPLAQRRQNQSAATLQQLRAQCTAPASNLAPGDAKFGPVLLPAPDDSEIGLATLRPRQLRPELDGTEAGPATPTSARPDAEISPVAPFLARTRSREHPHGQWQVHEAACSLGMRTRRPTWQVCKSVVLSRGHT